MHFVLTLIRFGWQLLLQKCYTRWYLKSIWKGFEASNDGTFTESDQKRMNYYALFVPAVSGASYALLAGRGMTHAERLQMTKLSAAAPMFDDYFDDVSLSEERLYAMITAPETFVPSNTKEAVFVTLLRDIKSKVKHFEYFNDVCQKVFEAQMEAKKQEKGGLTQDELFKITFDKGGFSTLLFKTIMEQPELVGEQVAIHHFGGMVQWVDDMFDVYEDTKAGIQTLATPEVDIVELRQRFMEEIARMKGLFYGLPIHKNKVSAFLDLQCFFFSRTLVCFEQLSKLQLASDGLFRPSLYERKPLICDMEKWENIQKWLVYFKEMRRV